MLPSEKVSVSPVKLVVILVGAVALLCEKVMVPFTPRWLKMADTVSWAWHVWSSHRRQIRRGGDQSRE